MAKVINKQQLSNGQISVLLRPDAATDILHDSWHTYTVTATTVSADIDAWLVDRKAYVESLYSATTNALDIIQTVIP